MAQKAAGFYIAPFSIDGEMQGLDFWSSDQLSEQWLVRCQAFLREHGSAFDAPWRGDLAHIETKFTAASGAALVTFRVSGKPASSLALAKGESLPTDSEVLTMFVESLRKIRLVREAAQGPATFGAVTSITQRPLMVVVPWPDATISEQDHECVRELAIHLAGAFLIERQ